MLESGLYRGGSGKERWIAALISVVVQGVFWLGMVSWVGEVEEVGVEVKKKEERRKEVEVMVEEYRFVEANPEVKAERPVETLYFSNRDQVAAQERPVLLERGRPENREDGKRDSHKVVQGERREVYMDDRAVEGEEGREVIAEEGGASWQKDKASETVKEEKREEGEGVVKENLRQGEEKNNGVELAMGGSGQQKGIMGRKPKARPSLDKSAVEGPLMRGEGGAKRRGQVAIDANFSEFGEYTQRMIEAICSRWYALADMYAYSIQDGNTYVVLKFKINKGGNVEGIEVVKTNAREGAVMLCKDAVQSRGPYGEWTEMMVKLLGERQEVVFTFYYY